MATKKYTTKQNHPTPSWKPKDKYPKPTFKEKALTWHTDNLRKWYWQRIINVAVCVFIFIQIIRELFL